MVSDVVEDGLTLPEIVEEADVLDEIEGEDVVLVDMEGFVGEGALLIEAIEALADKLGICDIEDAVDGEELLDA